MRVVTQFNGLKYSTKFSGLCGNCSEALKTSPKSEEEKIIWLNQPSSYPDNCNENYTRDQMSLHSDTICIKSA